MLFFFLLVVVQIDDCVDCLVFGFGCIVVCLFDLVQVSFVDVVGYVFVVEYGVVEVIDFDFVVVDCVDQVGQVLVDQLVGVDQFVDVFGVVIVCDQFVCIWYVDVVDVGVVYGWCGGVEVDVFCFGFVGYLDDLFVGGVVDDGVIYQYYVFVVEFQFDGVEFLLYGFFLCCLVGYDEGVVDVVVFDEVFVEFYVELVGQFQCCGVVGVWDWDDYVDVVVGMFVEDFVGKFFVYVQVCFVY